jgi:hypothetical protein
MNNIRILPPLKFDEDDMSYSCSTPHLSIKNRVLLSAPEKRRKIEIHHDRPSAIPFNIHLCTCPDSFPQEVDSEQFLEMVANESGGTEFDLSQVSFTECKTCKKRLDSPRPTIFPNKERKRSFAGRRSADVTPTPLVIPCLSEHEEDI